VSAARTVGIVSPGAMGSAVGEALVRGGARIIVTVAGRSARTRRLAEAAGLELVGDLDAVVAESDVVLSIAPPEAAVAIADDLARAARLADARPLVADLNAVAPATALRISETLARVGLDLVDGSISGPPPRRPGATRVYLSGARAQEVAALPLDGVECIVVGGEVGAASAVKMSTASVYKGTTALLAQALLAAQASGVLTHVLDDLRAGSPELVANVERRLASAASKSGRYVGEMREIASTQAAGGLAPSLFEAMAEIYEALAASRLGGLDPEEVSSPELETVLEGLRDRKERHVNE
jgi:3-hydroxyisobutyrate dehydrogenase-like beta-hydroxyacid dehydrogenase